MSTLCICHQYGILVSNDYFVAVREQKFLHSHLQCTLAIEIKGRNKLNCCNIYSNWALKRILSSNYKYIFCKLLKKFKKSYKNICFPQLTKFLFSWEGQRSFSRVPGCSIYSLCRWKDPKVPPCSFYIQGFSIHLLILLLILATKYILILSINWKKQNNLAYSGHHIL